MISRQTIELKEKAAYGWAKSTHEHKKGNADSGYAWGQYSSEVQELVNLSEELDKQEVCGTVESPKLNFFSCNRQTALDAVLKLGDHFCCYKSEEWLNRKCDCKYGGPSEEMFFGRSEQTGCPEMRTIHFVVSNMTDEQWNAIAFPSVVKK